MVKIKNKGYRKTLSIFIPLFIEQYVYILSIWTHLCILIQTSSVYIMYVLNVPICVNEHI